MGQRYTRTDSSTKAAAEVRPQPHRPLRVAELPRVEWAEGERFAARLVSLTAWGGGSKVGVQVVELPPGKQNCPFHYHLREEEHFYVLEGKAVLRSGEDREVMEAGDYVCFPAGEEVGHAFENPFEEVCRLLAIGTRERDEIAVYPDSGKAKLRGPEVLIPWPQEGLDYWEGEPVDAAVEVDPHAQRPEG